MLEVNKENFEAEVLEASKSQPVMVDYYSPKCEPCQELMPEVEALAEKYGEKMKFCKLDITKNRRLAISQRVMGLPTMCFYKDGEKVAQLSGEDLTAAEIEEEIKKHI
ncbi:thiol reductase thioredoxin [Anoxybacter fermentans]|uniref:Thioredoxin n=1 Tax=Anoxybacter fermentans TaxID=1323375 RepID=A0A3S9SX95_9FIRM|nr:thioredoxin family protein [Anoxybacter fermentans]AZR72880.1 thiol reductase thioredoxin [Anoxybacter fermentans]